MVTADIRQGIESHVCCIHREYYTFELQSVTIVPGSPRRVVLGITASQLSASGAPCVTANMRVTAEDGELHRVQSLLGKALEHWLLANAPTGAAIH